MPELPEVETVCRGLSEVMEHRTITTVVQNRPDLRIPIPGDFRERLTGRRVTAINRRAKYILIHLSGGDVAVVHLGMSGRMTIVTGPDSRKPGRFHHGDGHANGPHDHVLFGLDDGTWIIYNDPRRFGLMTVVPAAELETHKLFQHLGVEPLGNQFTADHFNRMLRGKQTPLKSALLDQRVVVGVGNIYACEALFRSRLSPRRTATSITTAGQVAGVRTQRLHEAVRAVLMDAIAAGGSSLRDYVQTDGELGYFQHSFSVYDRERASCPRDGCSGTIRRIVQANRSTFFCPTCQK